MEEEQAMVREQMVWEQDMVREQDMVGKWKIMKDGEMVGLRK